MAEAPGKGASSVVAGVVPPDDLRAVVGTVSAGELVNPLVREARGVRDVAEAQAGVPGVEDRLLAVLLVPFASGFEPCPAPLEVAIGGGLVRSRTFDLEEFHVSSLLDGSSLLHVGLRDQERARAGGGDRE
jgi:hypothetical protein